MQRHWPSLLSGGRWVFIAIILSTMTIGILGACDGGNSGNGCGQIVQDTKPLIPDPSWDCGMPEGIPSPESGELVFEAEIPLRDIYDVGRTPYGDRKVFVTGAGTVKGADIDAVALEGGLDYQLTVPDSNGAMEIDQVILLQTSDGSNIYVRTCGASADASDVRIVPDFEAPSKSAYSFLNTGKYAGTRKVDEANNTMTIKVYDVSNVMVDSTSKDAVHVTQTQSDDIQDQSWECREIGPSETKGKNIFTEKVDLGTWVTVGRSKNGLRNSIPLTGGTVSGSITGEVLFGGADNQIWSAEGINLDARYNLKTDDGELIIVRNCGMASALAPTLETRVGTKYSYLNDATLLSAFPIPNATIDAVTIRVFQSTTAADE